MKLKRLFVFLLAALLLVLPACHNPKEPVPADEQITAADLSGYYIVVPEKMSDGERQAVSDFVKTVYAIYGTMLSLETDEFKEPASGEILLGQTNRSETATAFNSLKYDDYFVGLRGGKLVAIGGSAEATAKAIAKLKSLLVTNKEKEAIFRNTSDEETYRHTYRFEDLSFNGVSVSEYTILYAAARQNREQTFAELLRKEIIAACGIAVPVQSDAVEASGNGIYFGGVNPAASGENVLLSEDDGVIYVSGNDRDQFYATQTLLNRLQNTSDGKLTVAANESLTYTAADLNLAAYGVYPDRIKVLAYNVQNGGRDTSGESSNDAKYQKQAQLIDLSGADIIALVEVAEREWVTGVRNKLQNKDSFDEVYYYGVHQVLLYNKTLYTLLDKGYREIGKAGDENGSLYDRTLVWAKLRSIASGAEFVVVPLHVEYVQEAGNKQLNMILDFMRENHPGLPVILAGDFNLTEAKMDVAALTSAGYSDARKTAVSANDRNADTYLKWDKSTTGKLEDSSIIDYVYAKKMSAQYFKTMMQIMRAEGTPVGNPSDHRPIYAELFID